MAGVFLPFWAGESRAEDTPQLAFDQVRINDQPASLLFGTSLDFTCLLNTGASRLGLKNHGSWVDISHVSIGISEPARVGSPGRTFTAPILLAHVPLWARPILRLLPFRLDGLIGWPEVRDNILIFDYDQRTINSVSQMPPETSGWLKLKMVNADSLLLELPLADGSLGVISVNIGLETSQTAIRMSAGPWREWQAAHPRTSTTNDVQLGPLTLSGVTVKELPAREAGDLLEDNPGARAIWQLGSSALARLDLVVDGKNGWAYLHPKSPRPAPNQPAWAGNWQIADTVLLSADNLWVYSGWYKSCLQDFPGAWADYRQALQLNPGNADALSGCGAIKAIQGDFSNAVSYYDQVINLRPDNSQWERLYRQISLWRLGQPPGMQPPTVTTTAGLLPTPVVLDPVVVKVAQPGGNVPWPETLLLFLDGSLDEKALLAAAKQHHGERTVTAQKAQAWFFLGEARLHRGDLAGALEWFKKCESAGVKADPEYAFAVAEIARLSPATPR